MQTVRRLVKEDGLLEDRFITMFNKPQCIGGIVTCKVIRKDTEQLLTFKQEVLESETEGTKAHAKAWLEVRKIIRNMKTKYVRLRVKAYEYDKSSKKYLTMLEVL